MNPVSIVICIICWLLSAVLPRCQLVSGFFLRPAHRSTATCCRSLADETEIFLMDYVTDEKGRRFVEFLMKQKEKVYVAETQKAAYKEIAETEKAASKEKEVLLKQLHTQAEEYSKQLLKEKEAYVNKTEEHSKQLFQAQEVAIKVLTESNVKLNLEVLAANSKLTVRGVMEYFADILKKEIIVERQVCGITEAQAQYPTKIGTTQALKGAATLAYHEKFSASKHPNVALLKESYQKCVTNTTLWNGDSCSEFFASLYGELSKIIHGAAWSGPLVLNTLEGVKDGEKFSCVVEELCREKFSLELVTKEAYLQKRSDSPTLPGQDVKENT